MYTHIDPNDEDAVVWLQRALSRALGFPLIVRIGQFDGMLRKAIDAYQHRRGLPVTGQADAATLQQLDRDLAGA